MSRIMNWAFHVTIAPRWLDPGETEAAITPLVEDVRLEP